MLRKNDKIFFEKRQLSHRKFVNLTKIIIFSRASKVESFVFSLREASACQIEGGKFKWGFLMPTLWQVFKSNKKMIENILLESKISDQKLTITYVLF